MGNFGSISFHVSFTRLGISKDGKKRKNLGIAGLGGNRYIRRGQTGEALTGLERRNSKLPEP